MKNIRNAQEKTQLESLEALNTKMGDALRRTLLEHQRVNEPKRSKSNEVIPMYFVLRRSFELGQRNFVPYPMKTT